jgi:hypothetical protein
VFGSWNALDFRGTKKNVFIAEDLADGMNVDARRLPTAASWDILTWECLELKQILDGGRSVFMWD